MPNDLLRCHICDEPVYANASSPDEHGNTLLTTLCVSHGMRPESGFNELELLRGFVRSMKPGVVYVERQEPVEKA